MKKNDKLTTIFGSIAATSAALLAQLSLAPETVLFKVIAGVGVVSLALGGWFTNKPEKVK